MEEFRRLERNLVARGVILDYYQDTMLVPNGNVAKWDFIDNKGAAAVVAVRGDGKILMVRQYRNALERETLEIPAGGLKGREEPTEEAAMRELQEETGYSCSRLELLNSIYTTVAFCNEKIDIYLARMRMNLSVWRRTLWRNFWKRSSAVRSRIPRRSAAYSPMRQNSAILHRGRSIHLAAGICKRAVSLSAAICIRNS